MLTRTTDAWVALLEAADIPCARVNRVEDLLEDAQLRAVGFFDQRDFGDGGQRRIVSRFRSPAARNDLATPAPKLGQQAGEQEE